MSKFAKGKPRPANAGLDLVGDKWTVLVFGSLCDHGGRRRFNAIRRDIPEFPKRA